MAMRRAIAPLRGGGGQFGRFGLARLRRHGSDPRVGRQPAIEKAVDPAVERRIVERVHGEMHAALLGARHLQSLTSRERPDLFHLQSDLGMELETESVLAMAEGLNRIA